jgi:hypothetical protein
MSMQARRVQRPYPKSLGDVFYKKYIQTLRGKPPDLADIWKKNLYFSKIGSVGRHLSQKCPMREL